ncbi:peptidoglycan recognition family protein [Streptomyces pristinaespiralis]|uniref:peptidoglycan recognition family protein n=1 Tax=Streptomyces pristinaespiralis TaxID=38300 RepID=UPI0037B48817
MKLVSRAAWGARGYRLPSGATLYSSSRRRGVKLHYLGTAYSDRSHDRCDDYVRQLQAQHMDGNGWSDIGYSFLVCTHGYVYEGRGLRRRNSANGNTTLNEQDYAVCLLVGSSGLTRPTDAQLHGARNAIDYCRSEGPAGTWLGGHRDGYATSCPGDPIYVWAKKGAPRPGATSTPAPAPSEEDDMEAFDVWAYKGKDEATDAYAYLRGTNRKVDALLTQVAGLSAAVQSLASQLGDDVDTEQVVAAVQQAIRDAVIQVDVDITGTQTA